MAKKAIIYNCIGNFGNKYKRVEVCDEVDVSVCAKEAMRLSTEIESYEVCACDVKYMNDNKDKN